MFKWVVLLAFCVPVAKADPAHDMAQKFVSTVSNFFTVEELVKLEKNIAKKICDGANFEKIHQAFNKLIKSAVGGPKAAQTFVIYSKLSDELGSNFNKVRAAINRSAQRNLDGIWTQAKTKCPNLDNVIGEANRELNEPFIKKMMLDTKAEIEKVSPTAWPAVRKHLDGHILFSKHGL
ncbi:hypothetical protein L596_030564 [Steinernema carpocapsae]|uniref:Uncharacterized protein n=1 Tax=Steinernema carpocapsae TaxID=34508 RepID=A0A4U5LPT1_STECR|nr:hypothetical protein L596_030564 [Steinernema carpocapsae]